MFCLTQKVRPLDRASRVLISMAEDEYGYFTPVSLEELCHTLVNQIPVPDESITQVHRFVESVIARNRETHAQTLEMQLADLTEKYKQLAAKVEELPCHEKDATIKRLEEALERRDGKKICKVCANKMSDDKIYANRCGHILCMDCWTRLKRSNAYCPFCRDVVVYIKRIYL
jgi:hypothetical protein